MATDLFASFNEQHMAISNKLRKRFMRKPNISEATEEFNALALQCELAEQPAFAGLSYLSAAKCENSIGNNLGEAHYYLNAARQFINAESKLYSLKCDSAARENIEAAISCYLQSSAKFPDKSAVHTKLLLELANNLALLGYPEEACSYYEQVMTMKPKDDAYKLLCLCKLADINIQYESYTRALEFCNEVCDLPAKCVNQKTLKNYQITRILLMLIINPTEDNLTPSLRKLFTDLTAEENNTEYFNDDLFILLSSIIISCDIKDKDSLKLSSSDLKRYFTLQQQNLVNVLTARLESNE